MRMSQAIHYYMHIKSADLASPKGGVALNIFKMRIKCSESKK